jgi:hypothetical protein
MEELSSPTSVEPPAAIKTSVVVDVVDCLKSEGTHVLLPWTSLKEFIFENFVCSHCKQRANENILERIHISFATSILIVFVAILAEKTSQS